MVPLRPWTLDSLARLAGGVLLCVLAGATLAGAIRYDAATARIAAPWFYLIVAAGTGAFLAALGLLLRDWSAENLASRGAVFLVLLFVGLNLGLVAGRLGGSASDARPGFAQVLIATLALQGASLVLVAWFLRRNALRWHEAFGLHHAPLAALAKGLLLGMVMLPILWLVQWQCVELLRRVGWEPQQQTMVEVFRQMESLPGKLYLGFAALFLAPLTEEILFRGLLYPTLRQYARRNAALAISALLFAALHANAATFLPLAILAVCFALLYDWSENLLAPVAAHATFNAGNVILLLVMQHFGFAP